MNTKKISIGTRPSSNLSKGDAANAWVEERKTVVLETEMLKRLTLDIPATLHASIKASCAMRNKKMVEEITEILKEKYLPNS